MKIFINPASKHLVHHREAVETVCLGCNKPRPTGQLFCENCQQIVHQAKKDPVSVAEVLIDDTPYPPIYPRTDLTFDVACSCALAADPAHKHKSAEARLHIDFYVSITTNQVTRMTVFHLN